MKYLLSFARYALQRRQLLWELVRKDIQGRFAGSFAGLLWTVIHPLAQICVYSYLFSVVFRIRVSVQETGTDAFAVFFLVGFLPWLSFSEALMRGTTSVVDNAVLITKVVFPVELLPLSSVLAAFMFHLVGWVLLLLYLASAGFAQSSWVFLPSVLLLLFLFCLGVVFFLSALCVFVRDVREILGIVLMVWFYGTPILYPVSFVPEYLARWFFLNPMTLFVEICRDVLLKGVFSLERLAAISVWTVGAFFLGTAFFHRAKRAFGDVL